MLTGNNEVVMSQANPAARSEAKRVGKFGIVGVINTLIDFAVYNGLHFWFGFGLVVANIISTTLAMIFSFYANKNHVFEQPQTGSWAKQGLVFFLVTAFGLYVLQNGTIVLLTSVWTAPLDLVVRLVHVVGLYPTLSDRFVINNGAKAVATAVSLTWNYIMYKKVVFPNA